VNGLIADLKNPQGVESIVLLNVDGELPEFGLDVRW